MPKNLLICKIYPDIVKIVKLYKCLQDLEQTLMAGEYSISTRLFYELFPTGD